MVNNLTPSLHFTSLFSAPVESMLKDGGRVLDIQESNGNWAIDLANLYPDASVTAIDVCNSYTKDDTPANCTFKDCAIDRPLPFDDASFDFVFMRRTLMTVPTDIRNRVLLPEVKRVLKPGGYFEWMASNWWREGPLLLGLWVIELWCGYKDGIVEPSEADGPPIGGPKSIQFSRDLIAAMKNMGYDNCLGSHINEDVAALGLMFVNCTVLGVPLGYAAGDVVGRSLANVSHDIFQSSKQILINMWQITEEEYNQRVAEVEHEWNHVQAATIKHRTVIARKIQSTNVEDPN
ncbi:S-adenosyl-L-methionine-dependent methyltransferase [Endogone sp. FLAS-F59071]|nr:S-adenosyl-L-methionine-dependent methyltransferase [Endogone sp. FLAS-F59071]|eukprot:RUS15368.1 S-adenosyl-L-methionine-dependent methyltransferase [Endogone sp. FLAS-F59071]